jgi:GntR family transcriptional regulator
MLIVVDPHSGVPVYRQLMDQIKFHIASGLLKPGDELPSTRALSSELGVNPMTISKAYVKAMQGERIRERKVEQLREALAAAKRTAQQLGIDRDEALKVFGGMLDEGSDAPPRNDGGASS